MRNPISQPEKRRENKVPLRTFVHRGEDVTAGCRKLHNEGLHDLYSYESNQEGRYLQGMTCSMHDKCLQNFSLNLKERNCLSDKDVDGTLILRCV